MTRHSIMTVYLPVTYAEAADRIAALASKGLIPIQSHWLSEASCKLWIAGLPGGNLGNRYWPTRAVIEITESEGSELDGAVPADGPGVTRRALGEAGGRRAA